MYVSINCIYPFDERHRPKSCLSVFDQITNRFSFPSEQTNAIESVIVPCLLNSNCYFEFRTTQFEYKFSHKKDVTVKRFHTYGRNVNSREPKQHTSVMYFL